MNITIIGKRWFEKTNGNTYHSAEVFIANKSIGKIPYKYGYGDQYLQTALMILQNNGYYLQNKGVRQNGVPTDYKNFRDDIGLKKHNFLILASDVARKKDL